MSSAPIGRLQNLRVFYELLSELQDRLGGARRLSECHGRMGWPRQGVYFFFEKGEVRGDSGNGPRVVRVGTHALTATSRTTLWNRLSQHRGTTSGGGNHRGSIFRLIVGNALMMREGADEPSSWGVGADPLTAARRLGIDETVTVSNEAAWEAAVSRYIGDAMSFAWLPIDAPGGPGNLRAYIERNSIALLSNYRGDVLDAASGNWLGKYSNRERVRRSGLWNSNHVEESYEPALLDTLRNLINGI